MTSFKNPLRIWSHIYTYVLQELCDGDFKILIKDPHKCYSLMRILDIFVEDCTGIKILSVEQPNDFVLDGDDELSNNIDNLNTKILRKLDKFVGLCADITKSLYNDNVDNLRKSSIELFLRKAIFGSAPEERKLDIFPNGDIIDLTYICPTVYCRSIYSTSLISKEFIEKAKKFSNNYIWEHMCGSGYNAYLFKQLGVNMYCTDCSKNWFEKGQYTDKKRYVEIDEKISEEKVRKIIKRGGALMYIWPAGDYPDLELWIRNGGKKVIVIVDNNPDHIAMCDKIVELKKNNPKFKCTLEDLKKIRREVQRICPVFPFPDGDEWDYVGDMDIPHMTDDIRDFVQFWVRK